MSNKVSDRNQKTDKPVKELLSFVGSYVPLGGLAWIVLGNISAPNESIPLVVIIIVVCAAAVFALVAFATHKTYAMPEDRTSDDYSAWEANVRGMLWVSNLVYAASLVFTIYCSAYSIISILRNDSYSYYYLLALLCMLIVLLGAAVCKAIVEKRLAVADKRALESCESSISKLAGIVRNDGYASTATCIPLCYDKMARKIRAILIFNSAYTSKCWMFPGGHTLPTKGASDNTEQTPDKTALAKMEQEVGFGGTIVDIRSCRDNVGSKVSNMIPFMQPHYTYLFELEENVKCYEMQGHRYHFDSVYIVEYNLRDEVGLGKGDNVHEAVVVELPAEDLKSEDIEHAIRSAINRYVRANSRPTYYKGFGRYVCRMLFSAHRDYLAYLRRNGLISGADGDR